MLQFITENINFLIADGKKFAHPLQHLDKTLDDLPIIAIDSFRHMYLFPDYNDMFKPGKLQSFVNDLHSGKLHQEFHYGPDSSSEKESEKSAKSVEEIATLDQKTEQSKDAPPEVQGKESRKSEKSAEKSVPSEKKTVQSAESSGIPSGNDRKSSEKSIDNRIPDADETPPDSTFVKLAPSEKRYTLVRNEL